MSASDTYIGYTHDMYMVHTRDAYMVSCAGSAASPRDTHVMPTARGSERVSVYSEPTRHPCGGPEGGGVGSVGLHVWGTRHTGMGGHDIHVWGDTAYRYGGTRVYGIRGASMKAI